MEVKTLIDEALNRANIVPRRQTAPGYLEEGALVLLKGIVSQYNNDNYLAFTQCGLDLPARQYIHIYDEVDTMAGENNRYFDTLAEIQSEFNYPTEEDYENDVWAMVKAEPDKYYSIIHPGEGVYRWLVHNNPDEFDPRFQQMKRYAKSYHVKVDSVSKLNTLCINRGERYGMYKLNWLPRADFDSYRNSDFYWTWTQGGEGEWCIEVKPLCATGAIKLKLDYNRGIELDMYTDLRIPDAYNELLTVSLTHRLATKYPRLDEAQMNRLEKDVGVMLNNVRTPKADAKQVLRGCDGFDDSGTPEGVMRGSFLV